MEIINDYEIEERNTIKHGTQCRDTMPDNLHEHYSTDIEPIEFIMANDYSFIRGNIIKYADRVGKKKGEEVRDVKKIIDYTLFLAFENGIEINEREIHEAITHRMAILKKLKKKQMGK